MVAVLVVPVVVVSVVVVPVVAAELVPPLALAGAEAGLALPLSLVGSLLSPLVAIAITATIRPTATAPRRMRALRCLGGGGGGGGGGFLSGGRDHSIRRARSRRSRSHALSGGFMTAGPSHPGEGHVKDWIA